MAASDSSPHSETEPNPSVDELPAQPAGAGAAAAGAGAAGRQLPPGSLVSCPSGDANAGAAGAAGDSPRATRGYAEAIRSLRRCLAIRLPGPVPLPGAIGCAARANCIAMAAARRLDFQGQAWVTGPGFAVTCAAFA